MDHEPGRLTRRRRNEHWGVEPDPELEDQLDDVTGAYEVVNRRRILWRDSAFILIGVVVALLLAQILLSRDGGTGSDDPTEFPTGAALGLTSAPRTLAPGETLGPILDPNLGIDATPTPIPVITLGPTPRQTPIPTPSTAPAATPALTPRITPQQTKTPLPPTPSPTAAPTPNPPQPPAADFSWGQEGLTTVVDFTEGSTGVVDTWSWDFGGGNTSSQANPSHDFGLPGLYDVSLTVTGPGGSHTITKTVTVS